MSEDIDNLVGLLEQRKSILEQIHTITQGQGEFIRQQHTDSLRKSINQRQKLIVKLQDTGELTVSLLKSVKANSKITQLNDEIDKLLESVIEMDKNHQSLAATVTHDLSIELKDLKQSRKTIVAYGNTGIINQPGIFDKIQ